MAVPEFRYKKQKQNESVQGPVRYRLKEMIVKIQSVNRIR